MIARNENKQLEDIMALGRSAPNFNRADHERVESSYNRLKDQIGRKPIYGISTYFGSNIQDNRDPQDWNKTQRSLLQYLCVGVGDHLPEVIVRRALGLQAKKLARGYSGIHPKTFEAFQKYICSKDIGSVPMYGSLGASGDLITMAHAVRPFFESHGVLGPRDVLSMVNTNSMMCSLGASLVCSVERIFHKICESYCYLSIGVDCSPDIFNSEGYAINSDLNLTTLVQVLHEKRAEILDEFRVVDDLRTPRSGHSLQARYSLRCFPYVLSHCLQELRLAKSRLLVECQNVADNPIVLDEGTIWHGGHFYAIGLSAVADSLVEVIARLSEAIDRQILIAMDHRLNSGLPENLAVRPDDHCKGIHQLVSSIRQSMLSQQTPSRALSFSCEGNNQDIVPCGMSALLQVRELQKKMKHIERAFEFISRRACELKITGSVQYAYTLSKWQRTGHE